MKTNSNLSQKLKIAVLVKKISEGGFGTTDIDTLLIYLRPHCGECNILRDISNFVAHSDGRDKGVTAEVIESAYYGFKYMSEYALPNRPLNLSEAFPGYIVKLFKLKIDKYEASEFRKRFKITKESARKKVDQTFAVNKRNGMAELRSEPPVNFVKVLSDIMQEYVFRHAFTIDDIFEQMLLIIERLKIQYSKDLFSVQKDKIAACILILMSNSTFIVDGKVVGKTTLTYERADGLGDKLDFWKSNPDLSRYESYAIHGGVDYYTDKGEYLIMSFPILKSGLSISDWSGDSIIERELMPEVGHQVEFVNFSAINTIDSSFKFAKSD